MAVSNVFTVAKILPLLMVVLAGAAVTMIHPAPWGGVGRCQRVRG